MSLVVLLAFAVSSVTAAHAQVPTAPDNDDAPAHVAIAEGTVILDREADAITATPGEPVVPGDRLRTAEGRAEIWFADGSTLALDTGSSVELQSESLVRLTAGRVYLLVSRNRPDDRATNPAYRIDTPFGSVAVDDPGEYAITLGRDVVELAVFRGAAELLADTGSMVVRSGERTFAAANGAPAYPQRFNAARTDDFERWVASRHDDRRGRAASTRYLPPNLQMYSGTFDRDGSWAYEADYGYVWYPVVDAGWRPYYNGTWRPLPRYGWTWVGVDRWGWPTHHYGRWGFSRSRWFWIPERRWAPAWVSWASAADYVSWCPLGYDNRPVFGFSLSVGTAWAGWVVLPRRSFGLRTAGVPRYAFDGRRLPRNTPFALHAQAPIAPPAFRRRDDTGRNRSEDGRFAARDTRRDNDRGRRSSATAQSDGWHTPLPPMAIPRTGERTDRRDGSRTRDRADWDGQSDRRAADDRSSVAGRRGSPRTDGSAPAVADRPTPGAPRAGIRVDPGVPRAGDRLSPGTDHPVYRVRPDSRPPDARADGPAADPRRRGVDGPRERRDEPGLAAPAPPTAAAPAGAPSRSWPAERGSRREPRAETPPPAAPDRAAPRAEPRADRGGDRAGGRADDGSNGRAGTRRENRPAGDGGGTAAGGGAWGNDGGARRRGAR